MSAAQQGGGELPQDDRAISAAMSEGNKHGVDSTVAARIVAAYVLAQRAASVPAQAVESLRRIREAGNNFSEWAIWAQKTAAWGMQTGYCPEQPKDAPVPVASVPDAVLTDEQITKFKEAHKIWGYMTCDDTSCDRLLIAFARAVLAAANPAVPTQGEPK